MILISRKVDYAILALHDLMLSPQGASARELADRYSLSRPFIANILKQLCQEGLVASHRGVHGGYKLAKAPSEITLDSVIAALDGPFQLMSCAQPLESSDNCMLAEVCPVRSPLRAVHERIVAALAEVTLEDLGRTPNLVELQTERQTDGCAADLPGQ